MDDAEYEPKSKGTEPLKHIVASIRHAKQPAVRLFVTEYYERLERHKRRKQEIRNEIAREQRAAKRAAPAQRIEAEGRERLKALKLAVRNRRGDKLLEQLVCREEELAEFWVAMKLAALETYPRAPTDAEVGALFESRRDKPCNKNQARARRKLVAALEQHRWVWLKFVAPGLSPISLPRDPDRAGRC
ncbi:hypothetical protein [Methylorubrum extorquens]